MVLNVRAGEPPGGPKSPLQVSDRFISSLRHANGYFRGLAESVIIASPDVQHTAFSIGIALRNANVTSDVVSLLLFFSFSNHSTDEVL